jgi:Clustered mitochondria
MNSLMETLCGRLRLRAHYLPAESRSGRPSDRCALFNGPLDIEGHQGRDGRLYVIDTSRLMPPLRHDVPAGLNAPARRNPYLYQLARPEFVQKAVVPLSSDAFSKFSRGQPDQLLCEKDVSDASLMLLTEVVPQAAKSVDTALSTVVSKDVDVVSCVHQSGLNVRYLGAVFLHCSSAAAKSVVATEIYARVGRAIVENAMLRVVVRDPAALQDLFTADLPTDGVGAEDDPRWKTCVARVLCALLQTMQRPEFVASDNALHVGSEDTARWEDRLADDIWERFGFFAELAARANNGTDLSSSMGGAFRPSHGPPILRSSDPYGGTVYWPRSLGSFVDPELLVRRFSDKLGVSWTKAFQEVLGKTPERPVDFSGITPENIAGIGVTVKQTFVPPFADALRSMGRSDELEAVYLRELNVRQRSLGVLHRETATAHRHLAEILADQGKDAEVCSLWLPFSLSILTFHLSVLLYFLLGPPSL